MTKSRIVVPQADGPEPVLPRYRYWGDTKPPQNLVALAMASPRLSVDATKATIRMYGPIDPWGGFWGVSAKEVAAALDDLEDTVTEIQLRVNSPGGSAWEGLAILNLLRAHPAKVTAVVDGLAASAASFIVAGLDDRVMSPGTQMMIHCSNGTAWGCKANELRKVAGMLDKLDQSMADLYAEAAGGTSADWLALMNEETWYTAKEAATAGLVDRVAVVPDAGSTATVGEDDTEIVVVPAGDPEDVFDLSMYRHPGRTKAPAPAAQLRGSHKPPTASAGGSPETEGGSAVAFSDEQVTTMRQKLGIAEDADEATILAALDEALEERTDPPAETTIPEGHVVIPAAKLADLEAGAALATQTAKDLADKDRDAFLDTVRSKYLPTNRDAWAKEYDRDPKATREHFAAAPDLVPVSELGHAQGGDAEALAADADYLALFPDEKPLEKKGA
jgi:ATP-dependent protease ClpP protease subunit